MTRNVYCEWNAYNSNTCCDDGKCCNPRVARCRAHLAETNARIAFQRDVVCYMPLVPFETALANDTS